MQIEMSGDYVLVETNSPVFVDEVEKTARLLGIPFDVSFLLERDKRFLVRIRTQTKPDAVALCEILRNLYDQLFPL